MRERKFALGKKAMMTDFMADLFAFFLYLLVLLIFLLMFSISFGGCNNIDTSNSEIISEYNTQIGTEQLLQNYLRTPVSASGGEQDFSELISTSCRTGNFEELKTETKKLLDDEINSALLGNTEESTIKRPKFEIYIKCEPSVRGSTLIYKTEKSPGCSLDLACYASKDLQYYVPLVHSTDASESDYALLTVSSCFYTYTTSKSSVSYAQAASFER